MKDRHALEQETSRAAHLQEVNACVERLTKERQEEVEKREWFFAKLYFLTLYIVLLAFPIKRTCT